MTVPEWISALTNKARKTGLPSAILADAMRARGEDPRDDLLWQERTDQLDIALFGRPVRELNKEGKENA